MLPVSVRFDCGYPSAPFLCRKISDMNGQTDPFRKIDDMDAKAMMAVFWSKPEGLLTKYWSFKVDKKRKSGSTPQQPASEQHSPPKQSHHSNKSRLSLSSIPAADKLAALKKVR